MTAFTVSTNTNWSALTTKTGSDSYTINAGATLTIDQDTRYGLNTTATTGPLGSVVLNDGILLIDGRAVRLIPFSGGSGNVPAVDTVITQAGVTGKLLGVWSSLVVTPPTAAGAAMPATGWIKVRQVAGTYAAGALTGIAATATGPDTTGWIEVILRETFTAAHTGGRLVSLEVEGEWFELGTTTGARNQTFQAPCSVANTFYNGVFIESAPGNGDFEPWPSAGAITDVPTDERGRVVWCDSQGFVRIGHNGTANAGTLPPAGCRVVVPNVIISNTNTTVGLGVNAPPTTTRATRFSLCSSGSGSSTELRKCVVNGRNFSAGAPDTQPCQWVMFQDGATFTASSSYTIDRCGIGPSSNTWTESVAILSNFNAAEFYRCVFVGAGNTNATGVFSPFGCRGGYLEDCWFISLRRPNNNVASCYTNSAFGLTLIRPRAVGGTFSAPGESFIKDLKYADTPFGTTPTTLSVPAINLADDTTLDGLSWVTDTPNTCHPYGTLISTGQRVKVRNVGTPSAYLNLGTVNATNAGIGRVGGILSGLNPDVRRCYLTGVRSTAFTGAMYGGRWEDLGYNKANTGIAGPVGNSFANAIVRGLNLNGDTTVNLTTGLIGNTSFDTFTTATTGKINFPATIPDAGAVSRSMFAFGGGARATGATYVQVPVVGAWVEWTTQFLRGHTGFQNIAQGPTANANYVVEYDIDKGSGFTGTYKVCNAANMSAEADINPLVGFRLKVRVRGLAVNTVQIVGFVINTTSTAALQASPLYPLDPATITFTGLPVGTDVVILTAGTSNVLTQADSHPTSTFSYVYDEAMTVDVGFINPGYVPFYIRGLSLTGTDATIPVAMTADRNYS